MTTLLREQIARIADGGAILFWRNGGEMLPLCVGSLELISARRLFVFEACGETSFHAHARDFAELRAPHPLGVEFWDADGELAAYLCPIAESDLNEAAQHAATLVWRAWQLRRGHFAAFIQGEFTRLARD